MTFGTPAGQDPSTMQEDVTFSDLVDRLCQSDGKGHADELRERLLSLRAAVAHRIESGAPAEDFRRYQALSEALEASIPLLEKAAEIHAPQAAGQDKEN